MAGHSKWANIKHKKAATDAKRGKVWTRLIKEIQVAARHGRRRDRHEPAPAALGGKSDDANMPKDNINRAIQRGVGGVDGANYEEIRYEGYGIGGAAIIVDTMTDNRTRTVAEVRHAFSKFGGNMGTDGSVSFLFDHVGQFLFAPGTPEDKLMEAALEAGADDVVTNDDGSIEVISARQRLSEGEGGARCGRLQGRTRRGHDEAANGSRVHRRRRGENAESCSTRSKISTTCKRCTRTRRSSRSERPRRTLACGRRRPDTYCARRFEIGYRGRRHAPPPFLGPGGLLK